MRLPWDEYFMSMAGLVSNRATCDRKHVGCVMVDAARHVIATGYNGSPPGKPHCDDAGHEIVDGHCVRTVHAEANAIAQAAKNGRSVYGATCFSNVIPCYDCAKLMMSAGIREVVFFEFYQSRYDFSDKVSSFLVEGGVKIRHLAGDRIKEIMSLVQNLGGADVREVEAEPNHSADSNHPGDVERSSVKLPSSDGSGLEG